MYQRDKACQWFIDKTPYQVMILMNNSILKYFCPLPLSVVWYLSSHNCFCSVKAVFTTPVVWCNGSK